MLDIIHVPIYTYFCISIYDFGTLNSFLVFELSAESHTVDPYHIIQKMKKIVDLKHRKAVNKNTTKKNGFF